jgi:CRP-like cAMP-binding protein
VDRPHAAPNHRCDLKHTRLCDGLTAAEVQELERIAHMQEVNTRQPLYLPGESSHSVYLLTQGRIILTSIGADGNVVTLEILEPGDVFGELEALEGVPRDTAAEALDHAVVSVCPWEDFRQYLATHPTISLKLTQMIGWRLRRTHSRIENLVCRNVAARLAHLLFELSQSEASRGVPSGHGELDRLHP